MRWGIKKHNGKVVERSTSSSKILSKYRKYDNTKFFIVELDWNESQVDYLTRQWKFLILIAGSAKKLPIFQKQKRGALIWIILQIQELKE